MVERARRLRSPVPVGGDLDLPHAVAFGAGSGHGGQLTAAARDDPVAGTARHRRFSLGEATAVPWTASGEARRTLPRPVPTTLMPRVFPGCTVAVPGLRRLDTAQLNAREPVRRR